MKGKARPGVPERADYSGPFDPDMEYQDFSKDFLAKMYNVIGRLFLLNEGTWERYVIEKWGKEEGLKGSAEVWKRIAANEHRIMPDALGVKERDLEAAFKVMQMDPGWPYPFFNMRYELQTKNYGRVFCDDCGVVRYWERIKDIEGLRYICHEVEVGCFKYYFKLFNPNIEVNPLKLPPRKGPDDVPHCIWEFTLHSK